MTAGVLRGIERLRKQRERETLGELQEARAEERAQADQIASTEAEVARLQEDYPVDPVELLARERYLLRTELELRRARRDLYELGAVSRQLRAEFEHAARETRTARRLAERQEEREQQGLRREQQRKLDAIGLAGWVRGAT